MNALAVNARVVAALGARSVKQTFRRPQLVAPIVIFPTLLLAVQTGGAGRAVDLPGFPEVDNFLSFMLAGAMLQSCLLAGNTGGIALAVDLEIGFTDRLLAAPISRFSIVLGRLVGTAAARRPDRALVHRDRADLRRLVRARRPRGPADDRAHLARGRRLRRAQRRDRALHRPGLDRPGPVPADLRDPVPLQRLLPDQPAARAGRLGGRVQPALVHRRGHPRAGDRLAQRRDGGRGVRRDRAADGDLDRAQRDRAATAAAGRR